MAYARNCEICSAPFTTKRATGRFCSRPCKCVASRLSPVQVITAHAEPDLNSGCWLWSGSMDGAGYGRASRGLAHRLSYAAFVGDPGSLFHAYPVFTHDHHI